MKICKFYPILFLTLLYACGIPEYFSDQDEIEPEVSSDFDLELKSADEFDDPSLELDTQISSKDNKPIDDTVTIRESDQKLDSTPVERYDSVLIEETLPEDNFDTFTDTNATKVLLPEIQKLELKDKIQYRIATINFPTGSSSISYKGIQQIKKIVKLAKERNAKIKIVGHTSKRTKDMPLSKHKLVNFSISHQRAQTVANLVIDKYNFPSENLITEAVSDSKPLFREDMPAGTKANQRTEIFIIY